jgi:hypothetical protein
MSQVETLNRTVVLKVLECQVCGVPFAIPQAFYDSCEQNGGFYHCPSGHGWGWKEGKRAREQNDLKQQLAQAALKLERAETRSREMREWAEGVERRLSAAKGQMTKLKKRVHNGVCPVCNRHFANLERHMHGQHPAFAKDEREKGEGA